MEFTKAFPQTDGLILVVIDGRPRKLAQAAAAAWSKSSRADHDHFEFVKLPDEEPFFAKNGLLFQPTDKVQATVDQLEQGAAAAGHAGLRPQPARLHDDRCR